MSESQSQIQQGDPAPAPGSVHVETAEYVLDLLVAAGYITREQAFQARAIARHVGKWPASPSPVRQGDEAVSPVDVKETK